MAKTMKYFVPFLFSLIVAVSLGWFIGASSAGEKFNFPPEEDAQWHYYKYTSYFVTANSQVLWAICDPRYGNLIYVVYRTGHSQLIKDGCPKEPLEGQPIKQ